MNHDSKNKDCLLNHRDYSAEHFPDTKCTCPPAADEVEQIRARVEQVKASRPNQWELYVKDEETLLRIVDQLRAELAAPRGERVCEWTGGTYDAKRNLRKYHTTCDKWLGYFGRSIGQGWCQYCGGKIQVKEQSND